MPLIFHNYFRPANYQFFLLMAYFPQIIESTFISLHKIFINFIILLQKRSSHWLSKLGVQYYLLSEFSFHSFRNPTLWSSVIPPKIRYLQITVYINFSVNNIIFSYLFEREDFRKLKFIV